jgi:hypothetical protein
MVSGMSTELPIACSLGAADFAERRALIAALGRDVLLAAGVESNRAQLRFRPESRDRVESFAAAETECCPFFAMRVDVVPEEVRLTIDAPAEAQQLLHELVAQFSGGRS